ncbi:MAG: hypothetical protein ABEJ83_05115 [Candidatus Nanohaloarchaea archaeon]
MNSPLRTQGRFGYLRKKPLYGEETEKTLSSSAHRSKTKITAFTILLLTAITLGTALSSTSNTAAPAGSAWIEGSSLHWADGSIEYWMDRGKIGESRKLIYRWHDHGRTSTHPTSTSGFNEYFGGSVGTFQS